MERRALLAELFQNILSVRTNHPVRVAIDGVDTAGKTTLADELGAYMSSKGETVIRASIDGFHNSSNVRYRYGKTPETYFRLSFNYPALVDGLLEPLGPSGTHEYVSAVFDYHTDRPCNVEKTLSPADAILLFDGVFLLREELYRYWDYKIFVDISFETVIERAKRRDSVLFGGEEGVVQRYEHRYIPGQQLYFRGAKPKEKADIVVDNNNPDEPFILPKPFLPI